ncbi:Nicotinamide/nicotinic acid mononucleotide adenylyltransferase 2 isoform 4 [Schistosoma japonicum]|uniref:Nicotinamide/nicotinic acid mononucleotide adenylyltransferase 2 isoform 4 n=1 Tax=Schistosoma japonicum TaxID=6182 RepID=A0A4Z2DXS2_SCHJA|nr:Nicotinamide/nicotinic acid mononucleotide adenylyltransferase 2 isoform 4 [Schistosoma japonicum]
MLKDYHNDIYVINRLHFIYFKLNFKLARDKIETSPFSMRRLHISSNDDRQLAQKECSDEHLINHVHQVVVGGIFSPVSDLYGKNGLLPASIRVELTRLACISTSDWLAVSNWECSQSSWTRTRVVLDYIRDTINEIYLNLIDNEETDTDSIPRKKICLMPSVSQSFDRLVNNDHEQMKLSSLEGMMTDLWLKSCFTHLESLTNDSRTKCNEDQGHTNDDHFDSHLTSLSSVGKLCHNTKNNANFSLSKLCVKLVCGADLLESFAVPNLWSDEDIETIARDYGLICISRATYDASKIINESNILSKYKDNIMLVTDHCRNSLSSTLVRQALSRGESVRYLVPDESLRYIYAHKLYGAKRIHCDILKNKKTDQLLI